MAAIMHVIVVQRYVVIKHQKLVHVIKLAAAFKVNDHFRFEHLASVPEAPSLATVKMSRYAYFWIMKSNRASCMRLRNTSAMVPPTPASRSQPCETSASATMQTAIDSTSIVVELSIGIRTPTAKSRSVVSVMITRFTAMSRTIKVADGLRSTSVGRLTSEDLVPRHDEGPGNGHKVQEGNHHVEY